MCGIVYGRRRDKRPVVNSLLKRFNKQRGRGTQGFGFIAPTAGKVNAVIRSEKEHEITEAMKETDAWEVLFHHRMPTSTANYAEVAHPITVKNKILKHNYYVVHNGVLRNEYQLKSQYEDMGFVYNTVVKTKKIVEVSGREIVSEDTTEFNDSESFAIDLALFLDGKKYTIDSVGSIAFVCFQTDKKDNIQRIYFGRNSGNPLVIEDNNDLFFIKSTGSGTSVTEDILWCLDYHTMDLTKRDVEIGEHSTYKGKGYNDSGETKTMGFGRNSDNKNTRVLLPETKRHFGGSPSDDAIVDVENRKSWMLSESRLEELRQEYDLMVEEKEYAEEQLRHIKNDTSSEEIILYQETIKECSEKIKTLEYDIQMLETYLEDIAGTQIIT